MRRCAGRARRRSVGRTARINHGGKSDFTASGPADIQQFVRLFQMAGFAPYFPRQVSVRSRLAIRAGYRRGLLVSRLLCEGFRLQVEAGVEFDFVECQVERWQLYEKVGYRRLLPKDHPLSRNSVLGVLVVRDRDYLWEVNPRLAYHLPLASEPPASVRFFYERYPDAPRRLVARSSQATD